MRHLLGRDLRRRLFYAVAAPLRRRWLALTGARTLGVRAVVIGADGRIALVRHRYTGERLYLPGGGVDRGESYSTALARELREELGIERFTTDRVIGAYHARGEGRDDHVVVYAVTLDPAQTAAAHAADTNEIAELVWADRDALPAAATPATAARIAEYRTGIVGGGDW